MELTVLTLDEAQKAQLDSLNELNPDRSIIQIEAIEYEPLKWFVLPELLSDTNYVYYHSFLQTLTEITINYG